MTKYIDADAEIKKAREDYAREYGWEEQNALACVIDWLEQAPSAPVRQEVHAAWKEEIVYEGMLKYEKTYKCMNEKCLKNSPDRKQHPFCPHCGATMDLDAKGE